MVFYEKNNVPIFFKRLLFFFPMSVFNEKYWFMCIKILYFSFAKDG